MGRVLIADDESDIRSFLSTQFQARGWSVDEAIDGDEALARNAHDYDVILLDQKMPGANGDEVAVRLRNQEFAGPIIFYSAYITRELESKLKRDVNLDLHIVAKTDFARLMEVIKALTSG